MDTRRWSKYRPEIIALERELRVPIELPPLLAAQGLRMKDAPAASLAAANRRDSAALSSPAVSVILPVFNKAEFLPACLDSVLQQTLRNIEVICVDDASTDASVDVLVRYAALDYRVQVIRAPANRGPGPTRNLGIACATAPFVQFTDADDLLPARALEMLHRRALADRVPVVRGTMTGFLTDAERTIVLMSRDCSSFAPLDERALWTPWWHQCYLISRALLVENGIGYPRIRSGEDPVFLASVLAATPRMSTLPDATYAYRIAELEKKQRASFAGVQAFLHHARLVKAVFDKARPDAWSKGYGPVMRDDVARHIKHFELTDRERRALHAEADALFATDDDSPLKALFVYRVCGLGGVETSLLNRLEALRRKMSPPT